MTVERDDEKQKLKLYLWSVTVDADRWLLRFSPF